MPVTPLSIAIEATQYTQDADPVVIQFSSLGSPLFRSALCHSTQAALIARIDPTIATTVGDRWGNPEVEAELLAYLAASGITAVIAAPTTGGA